MELFGDTFFPGELGDLWFRRVPCPACGSTSLQRVVAGESSRWLCAACERCWRPEHGRLRPVQPLVCVGCVQGRKAWCIARVRREFPRFGLADLSEDSTFTSTGTRS